MYPSMIACSILNAVRSFLATVLCLVLLLLFALESNSIAFAAGDPETDLVPRTDICTQNLIGGKNATQDPLPTNVVVRRGKAAGSFYPNNPLTVYVYDAGSVKDFDQIYLVVKSNGFEKFRTGVITLQAAAQAIQLVGFGPGATELEVVAVTQNNGFATVGLNFEPTHVFYGYANCKFDAVIGAPVDIFTKFLQVTIPYSMYPQSYQHAIDAQAQGRPRVLTFDKDLVSSRKRGRVSTRPPNYLGQSSKIKVTNIDEYPPKTFFENGGTASTRLISEGDNKGSGASMGNQWRSYQMVTGDVVELVPTNP